MAVMKAALVTTELPLILFVLFATVIMAHQEPGPRKGAGHFV